MICDVLPPLTFTGDFLSYIFTSSGIVVGYVKSAHVSYIKFVGKLTPRGLLCAAPVGKSLSRYPGIFRTSSFERPFCTGSTCDLTLAACILILAWVGTYLWLFGLLSSCHFFLCFPLL